MTWEQIPRNPSPRTLRQFAVLWILCFGSMGAWRLTHDAPTAGLVLVALAAVGVPGLVWPRLLRPIFVGWLMAVFPIGWVVSHVLLSAIFYGLITPIAMIFRASGRDMLRLKPGPRDTYWQTKPAPAGAASYLRQF
jgi:hypothetical protein